MNQKEMQEKAQRHLDTMFSMPPGVPFRKNPRRRINKDAILHMRLRKDLKEWAQNTAEEMGLSLSEYITSVLVMEQKRMEG